VNGAVLSFTEPNLTLPDPYPELDKLLNLNCPNGPCKAYVDVAQFPPYTRTRIIFKTGHAPGLFVWHW
jgi:hypothetical protein